MSFAYQVVSDPSLFLQTPPSSPQYSGSRPPHSAAAQGMEASEGNDPQDAGNTLSAGTPASTSSDEEEEEQPEMFRLAVYGDNTREQLLSEDDEDRPIGELLLAVESASASPTLCAVGADEHLDQSVAVSVVSAAKAPASHAITETLVASQSKVQHDGVAAAQRSVQFYSSFTQAMADVQATKVKTEHGGANNCLLYAYKVAAQELSVSHQKMRCATWPTCSNPHTSLTSRQNTHTVGRRNKSF